MIRFPLLRAGDRRIYQRQEKKKPVCLPLFSLYARVEEKTHLGSSCGLFRGHRAETMSWGTELWVSLSHTCTLQLFSRGGCNGSEIKKNKHAPIFFSSLFFYRYCDAFISMRRSAHVHSLGDIKANLSRCSPGLMCFLPPCVTVTAGRYGQE